MADDLRAKSKSGRADLGRGEVDDALEISEQTEIEQTTYPVITLSGREAA